MLEEKEKEVMERLHTRLLEMMQRIHQLFEELKIPYYMIEGTMLGAIRHKGFIPWDDDIDIAVKRVDFNKLTAVPKEIWAKFDLEFGFYTVNDNYRHKYVKLYDKKSTMIYGEGEVIKGVFVDVMPLDGAPDSKLLAKLHLKKIHHYKKCLWYSYQYSHQNPKYIFRKYAIKKGSKYWYQKLHGFVAKRDFETCKYGGLMMGVYGEREIMETTIYGKPTLYDFEGFQFYGVEQPERYLDSVYGKWKELPPKDKQKPHHLIKMLDLELPFEEYLKVSGGENEYQIRSSKQFSL